MPFAVWVATYVFAHNEKRYVLTPLELSRISVIADSRAALFELRFMNEVHSKMRGAS